MWIERAFRSGRIDSRLAREQSRGKPRRQRQRRREPAAAAFVELLAGNTGTAASCLVEVESPRGAKLRLELKTIATSTLAELIRAFAAS